MLNPVVLYFRKNHFILKAFDRKISLFKSAGIVGYWISCFKVKQFSQNKNNPKVMTLYDLSGIFKVWIFGLVIALVAFVIEAIKRL